MNRKRNLSGFGLLAGAQFALVVLAMLLLWGLEISLPASTLDNFSAIGLGTVFACITFFMFWLVYRFGGSFARTLLADLNRITALFRGLSWWQFAMLAALAGVGEELLFRGFLQVWLNQYCSITIAIISTSVIFGLLHYLSHAYFISVTLMSIVFGVGYYLSGSLLMVMVWHGVYDFIALLAIMKFPHWVGIASASKS